MLNEHGVPSPRLRFSNDLSKFVHVMGLDLGLGLDLNLNLGMDMGMGIVIDIFVSFYYMS